MRDKQLKQWNIQYFQNGGAVGPEWTMASKIKPSRWANENKPSPDSTYEIYIAGSKERPITEESVLREMEQHV